VALYFHDFVVIGQLALEKDQLLVFHRELLLVDLPERLVFVDLEVGESSWLGDPFVGVGWHDVLVLVVVVFGDAAFPEHPEFFFGEHSWRYVVLSQETVVIVKHLNTLNIIEKL